MSHTRACTLTASLLLATALAAASVLGACSSDNTSGSGDNGSRHSEAPSSGAQGSAQLPAPVMAGEADLDGATFVISDQRPLVVTVEDPANWEGRSAEESLAVFRPGGSDGSATYNPGFEARGPGTTTATLTGPDGIVHEFTITVEE
ncbi:MAG: hypothetical protein L0K65_01810 [Actinomyces sp.]|nr:hypothetical protein [Actinomyces sp.]